IKAEEAKRLADLKAEQERQAQIERQRREDAERKAREEAERKAREEAEREARLAEMERQRQEEIERQRRENAEEERRAMEAQRLAMLEAEQKAMELANSTEMQVYQTMLRQKIKRQWARPGTTPDNLSCVVVVQQRTGGVIWDARISECNTNDPIVRRSILAAVNRSSPLPQPKNPLLFLSTFEIEFTHND
ncbi:MAG: cell envelope integrity protein TolA, partial [Woeseiaceae bacterium]|nr:cell envelope integrity protein TolA [Woeseiaceae bacterium]